MDRPVCSCKGAPGAEWRPIRWKMGPKNGGAGVEKSSRKLMLVDGRGRSGDRVVGLVVSKTVVFVSNKSKNVKEIQEIQDRPRNPRLPLASRVIN